MLTVYVGFAPDMTGSGEEHDRKLKAAISGKDETMPLAMQIIAGEDKVVYTAIITQPEYQALVDNGAEEI